MTDDLMVEELNFEIDYPIVCEWWAQHNWPKVPQASLTKNGAFVYNHQGMGICAGWLFCTDSNIAWIEYIVKNPDALQKEVDAGLDLLIEHLVEKANSLGFKLVFTTVKSKALIARYARHGFTKGDEGMTQFILPIHKEGMH